MRLYCPTCFRILLKFTAHQSGIFRIGVLKKIGKIKTCFFPNQNFHNQKYHSKNGSKKLRGIKTTIIGVLTPKNAEFSSLHGFGHHEIDLDPTGAETPYFSILRHWSNETMEIWVSKDSK
jgi:hypothetical protein